MANNRSRLIIVGAGGHARVVADIFLNTHAYQESYHLLGFVDDDPAKEDTKILGLPVLGPLAKLGEISHQAVFLAIGDNQARSRVWNELTASGERMINCVHPQSVVSSDVQLGTGVLICAGVVVNPGTVIGNNVILNTSCSVDHDNRISNHVHLAPGSTLGGDVQIGSGTLAGIGCTILPQVSVGSWSIIAGGALVAEDVSDRVVAAGVPARVIRTIAGLEGS